MMNHSSHSPISSPSLLSPHMSSSMSARSSSPLQQQHHMPPPSPTLNVDDLEEKRFMTALFGFMSNRGTPIEKIPIFDHKELNLFKLYTCVITRGGLEAVIENKLWRQITTDLAVDPERTDAGFRLRIHYLKYLYPYERKNFLKMDDDEHFDYEAFEKHLSKSPSDKKGAVARKKKSLSPAHHSTSSPSSAKSTPSPSSSPTSLLSSPSSNGPHIYHSNNNNNNNNNTFNSLHQQLQQQSSSSSNYSQLQNTLDSIMNLSNNIHTINNSNNNSINQHNNVNIVANSNSPFKPTSSSSHNTNQSSISLNSSGSGISTGAPTVVVKLQLLEYKSLKRYNAIHRLKVSHQPSRKELVKAVIQHFGQQKIDEESTISSFLRRIKADTNTRIRPTEKV
ncbi:hypothetical protein SAMD00019534_103220, partial [Acytostelium subglobosum LB1]|uniref:hypothetical protein n=1 Tax=Acytostelium subglobosum LB1 TaxID=1410327 RepID=UPI00064500B3